MLEYTAYVFRIYPSADQLQKILKICGLCRKILNLMLADKKVAIKSGQKILRPLLAQYKNEYPFLNKRIVLPSAMNSCSSKKRLTHSLPARPVSEIQVT